MLCALQYKDWFGNLIKWIEIKKLGKVNDKANNLLRFKNVQAVGEVCSDVSYVGEFCSDVSDVGELSSYASDVG